MPILGSVLPSQPKISALSSLGLAAVCNRGRILMQAAACYFPPENIGLLLPIKGRGLTTLALSGLLSFRKYLIPEARFPRRTLLGSSLIKPACLRPGTG